MKDRQIKYADFPKIEEYSDIVLDILKSGKNVTATALAKYLKIKNNTAWKKLDSLEKKGLCSSKEVMVKDSSGKANLSRIYYIKDK